MSNDTEPRLYPMPNKTRIANSLCPLVAALLDLLEQAGPAASPFLHHWPRALDRPAASRALASGRCRPRRPVAFTLRPRHAGAGRRRRRAGRRSRLAADLYQRRFRRAIPAKTTAGANGSVSAGRSMERRDRLRRSAARPQHRISRPFARGGGTLSPARRASLVATAHPAGGCARRDNGSIIPPGRLTPCAPKASLCSRPMSGARATSRRIAHHLGSAGSVTEISRSQPSFSSTSSSMATSALLASSGGSAL